MSFLKRREVAILFYILPMLFILFEYYTGMGAIISSTLVNWATILPIFTYLIGGFAVFRLHIMKIYKRAEDWPYSVILITIFVVFLSLAYGNKTGYDWILKNIYTPLTILMFGFVGFYTVTALFRGSRIRNLDAAVLLACAIILMLHKAPIGESIWPGFKHLGQWLNDVPNTGVMRGVVIGVAVGILATFVRAILGLETSYLGGVK